MQYQCPLCAYASNLQSSHRKLQLAPVYTSLPCYLPSLKSQLAPPGPLVVPNSTAQLALCRPSGRVHNSGRFVHSVVLPLCWSQQEAVTLLESADGEGGGDVLLDHGEEAGSGEDEVEVEQAARALLGLPGVDTCPTPVGILPMHMQPYAEWASCCLRVTVWHTVCAGPVEGHHSTSSLHGLVASITQLSVATH